MMGLTCTKFTANLKLTHPKPLIFVVSQWQKDSNTPSLYYLIYRVCFAIVFFVTMVLSVADRKQPNPPPGFGAKWLIYLTNWGYTICTLQSLISAGMLGFCVLAKHLTASKIDQKALKFYQVYWLLNTVGTTLAFGITVLYWSLIYDPKTVSFSTLNYLVHGNNSVLMMIDLWIVGHPIRIFHFVYSLVIGLLYVIFSAIYYAAGGTSREGKHNIYNILNWDKPGMSVGVCACVMVFLMLLHLYIWVLHRMRTKIYEKCIMKVASSPSLSKDMPSNTHAEGGYDNAGLVTGVV